MDKFITGFDRALRVIAGVAFASRPSPATKAEQGALTHAERRHSAGLMRVNHVGEICAQALYEAQGNFSRNQNTRKQFEHAAREEEDHLAWTAERLQELGSHPSMLNTVWYAMSYAVGFVAAQMGDSHSLGFVVETEKQVESHLASHLQRLPAADQKSRLIVEQMRQDEIDHGAAAQSLGAGEMPLPVQHAMRAMSKVMTSVAYYI